MACSDNAKSGHAYVMVGAISLVSSVVYRSPAETLIGKYAFGGE